MNANPFDRSLPQEIRQEVRTIRSFISAQDEIETLVASCEAQRQSHKEAWNQRNQKHHQRRLEHALEREDADAPALTPAQHERQQREDDKAFLHIKHEDQLLELRRHEDYLQGRRALNRRKQVREAEVTVTIQPEPQRQGPTGIQLWAGFWAVCIGFVFLYSLSSGPAAIILLPVAIAAWAGIVRLPGLMSAGFDGGGTRGSGNAV